MNNNVIKIIKHKLFKISTTFAVVLLLGWGISSVANDSIKSATNNFSAMGFVSEISNNNLKIIDAKGSDKSGNTVYDLNIENLEKIQTNKNESLNLSDIKEGDKVIVQGLTNGSIFFIKRIISFASVSALVDTTTATTTDDIVITSTATTTDEILASSTVESDSLSVSDPDSIISTTTSTSSDTIGTTTATSTASTTEVTTPSIVESVIETVKEFIENIVEVVTGDTASSTPIIPPTESMASETQIQDIPLQNLIENTETVSAENVE